MKTNEAMLAAIHEYRFENKFDGLILSTRLQELLNGGVRELQGCFFLEKILPKGFDITDATKYSVDKTSVECEVNHIHIEDFLDTQVDIEKTLLEQGLLFGTRLQQLFIDSDQFMIIISFSRGQYPDCTVRFHKKRLNEVWVDDDIEVYEEGIAVID